MSEKEKKEKSLKDSILEEYDKGNIVFLSVEGAKVSELNNFLNQPADGILYDLNRLEEVTLTFLRKNPNDPKWINDYAVAKVIRALYERNEKMFKMLKEIFIYQDTWSADELHELLVDLTGKPIEEIIRE